MKIKMPQKFNPDEYKSLEELSSETKVYPFTTILNYDKLVYQNGKKYIILPEKENEPNLESRIKVGNGDQEKEIGKKIKIAGFVNYKGMIEDGYLKYQFDILPNPNLREDYVRGFVTKRDEIRSLMLSQEIGSNSINLNQYAKSNLKNNTSITHNNSKTDIQYIPMIIYGTVQDNGGIYIEIDAVKVGKNSLVYHNKENMIGIRNS